MGVIEGAKIIYSAGFFVTVSQDAIKEASREQAKSDQIYCMNLSAPFLMQVPPFKACFVDTMPYVDYLFGNETEAKTWAETEGWETEDIAFIATRLSLIPSAKNKNALWSSRRAAIPLLLLSMGTSPNTLSLRFRGRSLWTPMVPGTPTWEVS